MLFYHKDIEDAPRRIEQNEIKDFFLIKSNIIKKIKYLRLNLTFSLHFKKDSIFLRLRSLRRSLPRVYSANREKISYIMKQIVSRTLSLISSSNLLLVIQLQREALPYPRLRLSKRILQVHGS
jgi:hypothetical protein